MVRRRLLLLAFSFSTLTVGIGLTLWREASLAHRVRSIDEYWAATGMKTRDLESVLDDETCRSSQRYFLSCANALLSVAERLGMDVAFNGRLFPVGSMDIEVTEKSQLEPWKSFFQKNPEAMKFSFQKVWQELVTQHITPERQAAMTALALNGFLSVFRDPHTYIIPARYYQEFISQSKASSAALGIVFARSPEGYYLRKIIDGSSSSRAGLQRGDWIVSVNGTTVKDLSPQRLGDLLKSDEGALTRLLVKRGERILNFAIRREAIELPSVTAKMIPGTRPVGVVTIHKFAHQTCAETKTAIEELKSHGIRGLLLDLRDNSGGQIDEAACIVSLFVGPRKLAFHIRYLDPAKAAESYYGSESILWPSKVGILVNGGTASAAEILAGSLRDHEHAILVGERTFGKGSFQEGEFWSRNSKVAFFQTKGFYFLPSGFTPQLQGLIPDVRVDFRDVVQLREEDQFMNPLRPPQEMTPKASQVDLGKCLESTPGLSDDPQMAKAQTALFCSALAAGGSQRGAN